MRGFGLCFLGIAAAIAVFAACSSSDSTGASDGGASASTASTSSSAEAGGGGSSVLGDPDGPAKCVDAGGACIMGPPVSATCPIIGEQDCNPTRHPGGSMCCFACPAGKTPVTDGGGGHGCE